MQTRERFIKDNFDEKFKLWFGKVCLLTSGYYLLSGVLDLIREPQSFLQMLLHRLPAIALLLVAAFALKRWHGKGILLHYVVAFITILLCVAEAEHRVFLTGGSESLFFLDIIMMGILFVGYVPGSMWFWTPLSSAICSVYAVPLMLYAGTDNVNEVTFKAVYIVLAYAVLLYMRHLRNHAVLRQLALRYELPEKEAL
jgi:hypothetical protein